MVTGSNLHLLCLVEFNLVAGNDGRIVRFHDTRVANLAVLVAPIGVVVDRTGQVVHLLRYGCVLSTLCRSTEGDEFEAGIVPYFLSREEITQRVVLDTFTDDTLLVNVRREAVSQLGNHGPSVSHHAAGVRCVHTGFVVTVGTCCTHFPTLCVAAGTHQVVGRLTQTAESEVGRLHRVEYLFVAAGIVQTTHSRVVEITALLRVEVQTLDVIALYVRCVAAITVTGG